MSDEKYLKSEQYYSDLYDRCTVDQMRREDKIFSAEPDYSDCKTDEEKMMKFQASKTVHHLAIYFQTGERYLSKKETIKEWIARDRNREDLYQNAQPISGVFCFGCGKAMHVNYKILYSGIGNDKERVLFMYRCPAGCEKGRAFYDDGQEWVFEEKCENCGSELEKTHERDGEILTTHYKCSKCEFAKTDQLDMTPKEEEVDLNFEADKKRFCLSQEEGQKYYDGRLRLESVSKIFKESEEREKNKDLYDKVAKLQRLKIADLEKLLVVELAKGGYSKFNLATPEIGINLVVSFNVLDNKSERGEYDSKQQLQGLVKQVLENTNWRLMSDGVNYRLGFLTGRLRAYEKEEDLIKIIKLKS